METFGRAWSRFRMLPSSTQNPNLYEPMGPLGILTQVGGHTHKMGPTGGWANHKMAAAAGRAQV